MSAEKPLSRAEVASLCGCKVQDIPNNPLFSLTHYEPAGPVCAAYIRSCGPIDAITGPSGSGKTVGTVFKLIRFCVAYMPATKPSEKHPFGLVKVRVTVLRDNYRALYRTTLRSWFQWFPPDYQGSAFFGGQDRPARHELRLSTVREVDGVRREVPVDITVDFFAVGDVAIEELLKGYETSCGWCNEGDLLAPRVITFLYDRTGRFPSRQELPEGVKLPRMVAVDFNPPPPKHPLWKACTRGSFQEEEADDPLEAALQATAKKIEGQKKTLNFFHQPSGLSPNAENRRGKSFDDYQRAAAVMTEDDKRRFVDGLPGYARDGKPVYAREFNRSKHIAGGPLAILPGVPLDIGFDQGLSPAAIFSQTSSLGQVRVLRELWLGHGVGYQRFLEALIPLLTGPFRGLPPGNFTADPAGFYGADKVVGELAWAEAISAGLGHPIYPAPTNEPSARWEAVRLKLRIDIDVTTPGLMIDPCCEMLIEGFEAEYKFPKFKEGAPKAYGDQVVDNDHHNVHDALQYDILGRFGRAGVINEAAKAGRPGSVIPFRTNREGHKPGDFNVWNT
ncbi:hypothetical protein SAMN06265338_103210 [Rhodoblastus acidophilus]|uniref:TerL n=1 Tax=Rhodoblastus acidophilus TaxID=1074 RepID=A0A212RAW9_RHOAC|nr:hypothetical protein [Rhodoblastus acidophilus]PPQ39365.1 hypothetical protein CKO16_06320 [Rhodoblastus acidophilus]RAI22437.1 hypothetical protein CH337_05515 [Rhodoblastus acidophilus]SNB69389.1 hypothetical protein SAMN06265338_103210 [Rhodoblastus acidophilus]